MCARSQASGLISAECAVSICASENGSTMASVRCRASVSSSAISVATGTDTSGPKPTGSAPRARRLGASARLAPDVAHLADRGGAVGDARVERAQAELEAPGGLLVELGDQRVEAPALLVHQDDVTGGDALGGDARRDVYEGLLHGPAR